LLNNSETLLGNENGKEVFVIFPNRLSQPLNYENKATHFDFARDPFLQLRAKK
jgi:hypothetical protein